MEVTLPVPMVYPIQNIPGPTERIILPIFWIALFDLLIAQQFKHDREPLQAFSQFSTYYKGRQENMILPAQ